MDNHNASTQSETTLNSVSVVMSVYDQATHVKRTIESVLVQVNVNFELIVIDDGADTTVKNVLRNYKTDDRVIIIEQDNQGLTKALIKGCELARFDYIARIDAGDTMTENRLSIQSQVLDDNTDVGLVCSWVTIMTEEGYLLYEIKLDQNKLAVGLSNTDPDNIHTPFHASVMFRKSAYQQAGGYRSEFYFAQDCDLWARMATYCKFAVVPQFLTSGLYSPRGISGRYLSAQRDLTSLIAESNILRNQGERDDAVLKKAELIRPAVLQEQNGLGHSNFSALYFIARCLSRNHSKHAKKYWWRAISAKPLSILSWGNFFFSLFYRNEL